MSHDTAFVYVALGCLLDHTITDTLFLNGEVVLKLKCRLDTFTHNEISESGHSHPLLCLFSVSIIMKRHKLDTMKGNEETTPSFMDVHSYSKNASWELRHNFYFNCMFYIRKKKHKIDLLL